MAQVIVRENESLERESTTRSLALDARRSLRLLERKQGSTKMGLKDKLMADLKEAMKAHDKVRKDTISFARAAIKQHEVDNRVELSDEEIIPILAKQVKMRKDALADFEKAGRADLVEAYKEIKILESYLPEQMSLEEIKKVVADAAESLGIEGGKQNMGKLMGAVMGKLKGKADGNAVREAVTEYLS